MTHIAVTVVPQVQKSVEKTLKEKGWEYIHQLPATYRLEAALHYSKESEIVTLSQHGRVLRIRARKYRAHRRVSRAISPIQAGEYVHVDSERTRRQ